MGEMKYLNDARTVLAAAVSDTDLVMEVLSSAPFPAPGTGDWFWATIRRAADGAKEQVRVTAVSGTTWTIERGATPLAFGVGDGVYQRMNQQFADDLLSPNMQVLGQFAVAGGTADAMTATLIKPARSLEDGIEVSIRSIGINTAVNPTLDLDGLGAVAVTRLGNQSLEVGDIPRANYEMKLRYRASPAGWELLNPARMPKYGSKIVVLGASETVFPWSETWVDHIRKAFNSEGVDIEVYHTGAGAITHYLALDASGADPITGQTRAEFTNDQDADLIIVELGLNDAILAVGGRSQAQMIADAEALYANLRANNPNAMIGYSRLVPYDEDRHGGLPVTSVKKKYCVPYMHQYSTIVGEELLWTSQETELDQVLSSTMQDRLTNWKALDTAIQGFSEVDVVIDTNYFYPARLGLISHDRVHPNSQGHYFFLSDVWKEFQTNSTLRTAIPELTALRSLGDFTDFDNVWDSAVMLDSGGDGYVVDPDWTDGFDYPMWINTYANVGLISHAAFWGNQQRPSFDVSDRVNRNIGQIFSVVATGLWPNAEIFTKLWLTTDSEPTTWNADIPPKKTSKAGTHIGLDQPTVAAGNYYIKYKVGDDVFGPFPVTISGIYKGRSVVATFKRSTVAGNVTPGTGWRNVVLDTEVRNNDPDVITHNPVTGLVQIAHGAGYTRYRYHVKGVVDCNANGVFAIGVERNGVDQNYDEFAGDGFVNSSLGTAPAVPLNAPSQWIDIDSGGESLYYETNFSASGTLLALNGIIMEIEVE